MNTLFAAVRCVHYASTLLLYGELVCLLVVAGFAQAGTNNAYSRRFEIVTWWSLIASVVSGIAWLAVAAAVMSGLPLAGALDRQTLSQVLEATEFGHVWTLRFGLAAVLAVLLVAFARPVRHGIRRVTVFATLAVAAIYVASLAWAGHAAAGDEPDRDAQILADAVHVLAAGAWLGALPGLVFMLRQTAVVTEALAATRGFSMLGMACVALLALSGTANAWYLVGDMPALIGTRYGHLLLIKLALFGVMLGLAMANRWYVTVRLANGDAKASRILQRNAIAEIAAGLGILAVVGLLGVTPPAIHATPVWPFAHTLSLARVVESAWLQLGLAAAGLSACVCVAALIAGIRRHRRWQALGNLAAIAVLAAIFVPMLAVPAYPSTYQSSPIAYTTDAIVAGSALYVANCRDCHGLPRFDPNRAIPQSGAGSLEPTEHALRHRDGEHYWWIAHGVPGTPMPAFESRLSGDDIWNLIAFLNAQVEADEATAMTDRIKPLRAIVAPDFAFEAADRPQESLRQLRGKAAVLLVLYTLPDSLARLRELAGAGQSLAAAGARVIAAPLTSASRFAADLPDDVRNKVAFADATVAAAYALFARQFPEFAAPAHVELVIDRDGYLRVRWLGVGSEEKGTAEVLDRLAILRRETSLPPAARGHRHR